MKSDSSKQPPARKALPPFEALRAFDAVARMGGIRKAAQWLDRDHAVISRHLRLIETWSGVSLVERTPAGVLLTEAGQMYHDAVSIALDDIAHATLDLLNTGQHNKLIVWSSPSFALHWLSSHIAEFEQKIPGLEIEVRPADGDPDFASREADLQIRFIATYQDELTDDPTLRQELMTEATIIAVAAPDYFAERDAIKTPEDLLKHQLIHEQGFENWEEWLKSYDVATDEKLSGPSLWQGHLTMDSARHGNGIALSNSLVARNNLQKKRLLDVGEGKKEFEPRKGQYILIARKDRWNESLVRRFRGWLKQRLVEDQD